MLILSLAEHSIVEQWKHCKSSQSAESLAMLESPAILCDREVSGSCLKWCNSDTSVGHGEERGSEKSIVILRWHLQCSQKAATVDTCFGSTRAMMRYK